MKRKLREKKNSTFDRKERCSLCSLWELLRFDVRPTTKEESTNDQRNENFYSLLSFLPWLFLSGKKSRTLVVKIKRAIQNIRPSNVAKIRSTKGGKRKKRKRADFCECLARSRTKFPLSMSKGTVEDRNSSFSWKIELRLLRLSLDSTLTFLGQFVFLQK